MRRRGAKVGNQVAVTTQVSLGELLRLAFPAGIAAPLPELRERSVSWVVMAGTGIQPAAGDFLLCGTPPSRRDLSSWAQRGVAGVAIPAGSTQNNADLAVVVLPPGASLRDIQQQALELIVNRQSYLIERGALVSETLMARALEGGGLDGLTRAMYDLTGKTVVVQDKRLQPLAQAVAPSMSHVWPEVLNALSSMSQLPEGLRDRRQAAAVAGWRDQSLPGGLMRLVCPIVSKGMARGYLSVVGGTGDIDALDQLVVEYGAAASPLEMA